MAVSNECLTEAAIRAIGYTHGPHLKLGRMGTTALNFFFQIGKEETGELCEATWGTPSRINENSIEAVAVMITLKNNVRGFALIVLQANRESPDNWKVVARTPFIPGAPTIPEKYIRVSFHE